MPNLLVKPSAPDKNGRVHAVTPASAGWTYVGFEVYRLDAGKSVAQQTGDREACLVMLSGGARAADGGKDFGVIGGRTSPFEPDPWSLYVPAGSTGRSPPKALAKSACASSPGTGRLPARADRARQGRPGNARAGHQHPSRAQHPAGVRTGGEPARRRSHHARRPLVELSAAQARPRRAAGGIAPRRDLLPPPQPAAGFCPAAGLHGRPFASTKRWRRQTATWCWCRAAIIRSARRTATISTIST